jgi:hypothetical protein
MSGEITPQVKKMIAFNDEFKEALSNLNDIFSKYGLIEPEKNMSVCFMSGRITLHMNWDAMCQTDNH